VFINIPMVCIINLKALVVNDFNTSGSLTVLMPVISLWRL
jgi:hypothetical protein